jgi:hypothetical protein
MRERFAQRPIGIAFLNRLEGHERLRALYGGLRRPGFGNGRGSDDQTTQDWRGWTHLSVPPCLPTRTLT